MVAGLTKLESGLEMISTQHIDKIAQAIGFLSRIPVPAKYFASDDGNLSETSGYFVIAGILISLPIAIGAALLSSFNVGPMIIAALVLASLTFITGALHEDGLSDCADGFWGTSKKEKMLKIMKDSRLGTYGTLSLVFSFLLKFAALTQLADTLNPILLLIAIVVAAGLSRAAMVWHWSELPPARTDGVAAGGGKPSDNSLRLILISSAIIAILSLITIGFVMTGVALVLITATSLYFTKLTEKKIWGHTGDTIGATQQIGEVAIYLGLAIMV